MKIIKNDSNQLFIKESGMVDRIISLLILTLALLMFYTPLFDEYVAYELPVILQIMVILPLLITIFIATDDTICVDKTAKNIIVKRSFIFFKNEKTTPFSEISTIMLKGISAFAERGNNYRLGYTNPAGKFKLLLKKAYSIDRSSIVVELGTLNCVEMGQQIASALQVPFKTYPNIPGTEGVKGEAI